MRWRKWLSCSLLLEVVRKKRLKSTYQVLPRKSENKSEHGQEAFEDGEPIGVGAFDAIVACVACLVRGGLGSCARKGEQSPLAWNISHGQAEMLLNLLKDYVGWDAVVKVPGHMRLARSR